MTVNSTLNSGHLDDLTATRLCAAIRDGANPLTNDKDKS